MVVRVRIRRAPGARLVAITAAAPAAVDLYPLALARDAVPLAAADGRGGITEGRERRGRTPAGARRQGRADGGGRRVRHVTAFVFKASVSEAPAELVDGGRRLVVCLAELAGCVRLLGFRVLDLGRGECAAFGDVDAHALGVALTAVGRGGLGRAGFVAWDVEDVEFAAGSGLGGELLGGVVGDVVPVHDVVVPVPLTQLQHGALEAEGALP